VTPPFFPHCPRPPTTFALAKQSVQLGSSPQLMSEQRRHLARYGLDVEIVNFTGDAPLQRGLFADSVDFGLGGGPAMAFTRKESTGDRIAAIAYAPVAAVVLVDANSAIAIPADLNGKAWRSVHRGRLPTGW
jgi:ABC-type nitrate/sulfonate/bicarbonate transport system substrate-binding protein